MYEAANETAKKTGCGTAWREGREDRRIAWTISNSSRRLMSKRKVLNLRIRTYLVDNREF